MKIFIFFAAGVLFIPWVLAQAPMAPQAGARGSGPFRVAILPVTIHSPENLDYMQAALMDMLTSRMELEGRISVLEKGAVKKALSQDLEEIDSETARKLGETLGADYVVFGSLTKLGDSSSLDLKIVEVKGEKPGSSVYIQAKKMEEVIAQVDVLARKIDEKILGYPLAPPAAEKAVVAEKPAATPPAVAAIPIPPPPGMRPFTPQKPERGGMPAGFWQSSSFPFKITGMAVGDLDGDGRNEIALIDERNLYIYRYENEFKLLKKMEGGRFDKYLAIDVADLDKDGKAEIFVTNYQSDRLSSFVVGYRDGTFRTVSSGHDWFLRAVQWNRRGVVLLGQKKGYERAFEAAIYEMGWDGKSLKGVRKAELPKLYSIYGFTPMALEGKDLFLALDSDFQLRALDSKGKVIWRSRIDYGSANDFQAKSDAGTVRYSEGDEYAYVNVRIISQEDQVFIIRNTQPLGDLFRRQKYYNHGELQKLQWMGGMFAEQWRSAEISGYLPDFQIGDIDGDGKMEIILAVNLPRESMFSGAAGSALLINRME